MAQRKKLNFRVRALTIACTDVKRSAHFYEKVLGAKRLPTDNGIGWWYQLGTLAITLMPNAAEPSPAVFPDHAMSMLWLEVDDLAATAKHFAKHKVNVIEEHEDLFFMIADPDGLLIEVWQVTDED